MGGRERLITRGGAKHLTFANQVSNCRCVNCMPAHELAALPTWDLEKGGWFKSLTMGTQEWTAIKISLTCTEVISNIQELPQLKMWDVECFFRDMVGTFYTSHRQVNGGKFSQTNGSLVAINYYCFFIKCLHLMYVRANIYYNVPVDHPPSQVTAI